MTITGTTVKSLQTELISVTSGRNLGISILPVNNLKIVIAAVMTRKTTASATANADVCLNESAVQMNETAQKQFNDFFNQTTFLD